MKQILKLIGYLIFFISSLASLVIDFQIVVHEWGFTGAVISFLIFPVALIVVPFFALIKYSVWYPVLISYGGGFISILLITIGGGNDD